MPELRQVKSLNFYRSIEKQSLVFNSNLKTSEIFDYYKNEYKVTSVGLIYNFIYKEDTVYTIQINVNDSLKIANSESFKDGTIETLIGWQNALSGNFSFNYDKLKLFIKTNKAIDTAYKEIIISYEPQPGSINNANKIYIETKFFWKILIYERQKYIKKNRMYQIAKVRRQINIDTENGSIISDTHYSPIRN